MKVLDKPIVLKPSEPKKWFGPDMEQCPSGRNIGLKVNLDLDEIMFVMFITFIMFIMFIMVKMLLMFLMFIFFLMLIL